VEQGVDLGLEGEEGFESVAGDLVDAAVGVVGE
jgi:hypothetical protein